MISAETVAHHLRLFGLPKAGTGAGSSPFVVDAAGEGGWVAARQAAERGVPVVLLSAPRAAEFFNGSASEISVAPDRYFSATGNSALKLRSLHDHSVITAQGGRPVVVDAEARPAWTWLPFGVAGMLLVGTDLYRDLVRYRQGDPRAADNRPSEALWGFAGERPVYLYEDQLAGEPADARFADWWCEALVNALVLDAGLERGPLLPGGAPGAIVITGDDDQASLANYAIQRDLLGNLPITYLLHPLTKHDPASLARFSAAGAVEWALHPDALDAPDRYAALYEEQHAWFEKLVGHKSRSVRNHGFLNDGYWGHLPSWLRHGTEISSNLPGFDGRVLNGSLLPARMVWDGELTNHWSVLTAIGDGIVFVHGDDAATAAARIRKLAQSIVQSGIPGVIVLNLHPDNVARTASMHHVLHDLVREGFVAWNLSQCLSWFSARDSGEELRVPSAPAIVAPSARADETPAPAAHRGRLLPLRELRRRASRFLGMR